MSKRARFPVLRRHVQRALTRWWDLMAWVQRRLSLRWILVLPLAGGLVAALPGSPLPLPWLIWHTLWGDGAWPLAVFLALAALVSPLAQFLVALDPRALAGLEVVMWTGLALWHGGKGWLAVETGGGGGLAGWGLEMTLRWLVGPRLTVPVLGVLAAGGGMLVYRYGPWRWDRSFFPSWVLWARAHLGIWLGWHLPVRYRQSRTALWARLRREWFPRASRTTSAEEPAPASTPKRRLLPPMDLLEPEPSEPLSRRDVERRARLIEETLAGFGVPVRVVAVNEGPAVTQFCVRPLSVQRGGKERRVPVRRILALQNDLALMLAAAPVRIEAPVPGKSYVGIEVPNTEVAVVRLAGVMAAREFQRLRSPLALALGRDVSGRPVVADLARLPHLLIAGATGSGKSVAISSMIVSWLMRNSPQQVRLLLVDPKRVELTAFNGVPHLVAPVVTDVEEVLRALTWVLLQMDDRYRAFARAGVRDLAGYNRWTRGREETPLPRLVVIIDELADIMMGAGEEAEHLLARLAQMARATGIHLVVATQRPSVDVVTGLIKANFPARLAFAVTSQVDSRVILDIPGAEALLGRGDALFMRPDSARLIRLQGCFVSDEEVERVAAWWREDGPPAEEDAAQVPWAGLALKEGQDLFDRAIALVRQQERVSASFLQRRLHIGFRRAQALVEELEALGVVGADEGGGRGRRVLIRVEEEKEDE